MAHTAKDSAAAGSSARSGIMTRQSRRTADSAAAASPASSEQTSEGEPVRSSSNWVAHIPPSQRQQRKQQRQSATRNDAAMAISSEDTGESDNSDISEPANKVKEKGRQSPEAFDTIPSRDISANSRRREASPSTTRSAGGSAQISHNAQGLVRNLPHRSDSSSIRRNHKQSPMRNKRRHGAATLTFAEPQNDDASGSGSDDACHVMRSEIPVEGEGIHNHRAAGHYREGHQRETGSVEPSDSASSTEMPVKRHRSVSVNRMGGIIMSSKVSVSGHRNAGMRRHCGGDNGAGESATSRHKSMSLKNKDHAEESSDESIIGQGQPKRRREASHEKAKYGKSGKTPEATSPEDSSSSDCESRRHRSRQKRRHRHRKARVHGYCQTSGSSSSDESNDRIACRRGDTRGAAEFSDRHKLIDLLCKPANRDIMEKVIRSSSGHHDASESDILYSRAVSAIPKFDPSVNVEIWVAQFCRETEGLGEKDKMQIFRSSLQDRAYAWFHRTAITKPESASWSSDKWTDQLLQKYETDRRKRLDAISKRKQGDREDPDQFIDDVVELCHLVSPLWDEATRMSYVKNNVHPKYRKFFNIYGAHDKTTDAMKLTLTAAMRAVDEEIAEEHVDLGPITAEEFRRAAGLTSEDQIKRQREANIRTIREAIGLAPPLVQRVPSSDERGIMEPPVVEYRDGGQICYFCGERGHVRRYCPQRKRGEGNKFSRIYRRGASGATGGQRVIMPP
jgi:hypothetical protein